MGHPGNEAGAFTVDLCCAVLVITAEQTAGLGREGRFEVESGRQRERGGCKPQSFTRNGLDRWGKSAGLAFKVVGFLSALPLFCPITLNKQF